MPIKSAKQFKLMQAAKMGGVGSVDPSVATEFLSKTPPSVKSNFAKSPGKSKSSFPKMKMKSKRK